jgi:hypothetical protein
MRKNVQGDRMKVGDLIKTEYGLVHVTKVWAAKCVSGIILTGTQRGEWVYLRGLDFVRSEVISESR